MEFQIDRCKQSQQGSKIGQKKDINDIRHKNLWYFSQALCWGTTDTVSLQNPEQNLDFCCICWLGWGDFKGKMLCSMLCRIVVGPHSKIACLNVAFSLDAGPQQILTVTLKQKKLLKIYLIDRNVWVFKNRKSAKSLHPTAGEVGKSYCFWLLFNETLGLVAS